MKHQSSIAQVIDLGILAGMRTASAAFLLNCHFRKYPSPTLSGSRWGWIASDTAKTACTLMAAGEVLADKIPSIPNRTDLPGLIGRGLAGAAAGAILNKASNGKMPPAPLIGAASAIASTYASFYLRQEAARHLKPTLAALMEDAFVYGIGRALLV
jgi:uncharacterized membrane protein